MRESGLDVRMKSRFSSLYREIQEYILKFGAGNYAQINARLLGKAVLDYFEDIERLKAFEGMDRINEAKIYSYQAYWLMRRKPIQIANSLDIPEVGTYLNEYIFAIMFLTRLAASGRPCGRRAN